ncbi:MAG: hypothetical protein HRU80_00970 [Ignavibacteriales bacterium]|nr:MAG: hypothetical protein HRU80_00970 [Ignavibacteriales bacterium]
MKNYSFLPRYGLAYACHHFKKTNPGELTAKDLSEVLNLELSYFRLATNNDPQIESELKFEYKNVAKGNAAKGLYLSSHVLSTDKSSEQTHKSITKIISELKNGSLDQRINLDKSFSVTTSKINNGKRSQTTPTGELEEAALSAIGAITMRKPARYDAVSNNYSSIIPDLELNDLILFIKVFENMQSSGLMDSAKTAKVNEKKRGFKRPQISYGNFPFAPLDSTFAAIGLLAALGQWAKNSETFSEEAIQVCELLGKARIYIVSYSGVHQTQFSHAAVSLSKSGALYNFLQSLYRAGWQGLQNKHENDRKLFFLFTARFLQFFTPHYFKDFLSIRMEYENEITNLFKEYFTMNGIKESHVQSVSTLGRWINRAAYFYALENSDNKQDYDKINTLKAKTLAEIESTVLAAKSATALISQVITRIGRLSYQDAPAEAELFINAVMTGEIPLQNSKELIMAYSRIKNTSKTETEINNNPYPTEGVENEDN